MTDIFTRTTPVIPLRGMHLDLKGHQPTVKRLLEIPRILAAFRFNVVLIEWEDTFCWRDSKLTSPNAYSAATINKFFESCRKYKIEPIPLIQTFGHLENVLRHKSYSSFREVKDDFRDLCPSKPKSRAMIMELIDQVLDVHKGFVNYFHLGADEVRSLGSCKSCSKTEKESLFWNHIEPLCKYITGRGVRPIIWHDMLEKADNVTLSRISKYCDLMLWEYRTPVFASNHHVTPELIKKYKAAGIKLWAASSFKGADGVTRRYSSLKSRVLNNLEWCEIASNNDFAGTIATGWSRYSTCCAQCEPLESSWDSLFLTALILWNGKISENIEMQVFQLMKENKAAKVLGSNYVDAIMSARRLEEIITYCKSELEFYLAMAKQPIIGRNRINPRVRKELQARFNKVVLSWRETIRKFESACKGNIQKSCLDEFVQSQTAILQHLLRVTGITKI